MPKFNADFWEVTLSEKSWAQFSSERHLYHEHPEEADRRRRWSARTEELWPGIAQLIQQVLTPRQREIVRLYYLTGLNQRQIADQLSISQQAVSEHLYGKWRNGHAVGGALRKLRKACAARGLTWDPASRSDGGQVGTT